MTYHFIRCRLCDKNAKKIREFANRSTEVVNLYRCKSCGSEFLDPQPSDDWLAEEYRGYYTRRGSVNRRPKALFFEELFKTLELNVSDKSVLEIGAGEGDAIFALSKRAPTAKFTAVESNEECREFYKDLPCSLEVSSIEHWLRGAGKGSFDVILMFDLIEHLRDPIAALKALCTKNLKSGGYIVATCPNADSWSRHGLQRLWPQYKVEHLFYFGRHVFNHMARNSSLQTETLRPLTKHLPIDYLVNVGKNFGPPPTRSVVAQAERLLPSRLKRTSFKVRLGEWVWVARKEALVGADK